MIFGSEVVKIEAAWLLVSQVSGATRSKATDTQGVCRRDDREEEKRRRHQKR